MRVGSRWVFIDVQQELMRFVWEKAKQIVIGSKSGKNARP